MARGTARHHHVWAPSTNRRYDVTQTATRIPVFTWICQQSRCRRPVVSTAAGAPRKTHRPRRISSFGSTRLFQPPPRAPPQAQRALGHKSREAYPRTRELTVLYSVSRSHPRQRQPPREHQKVRDPEEIGIGRPVPVQGHERIGGMTLLEVDRILLEKVLGRPWSHSECNVGLGGRIRPAHRRSGLRSGPLVHDDDDGRTRESSVGKVKYFSSGRKYQKRTAIRPTWPPGPRWKRGSAARAESAAAIVSSRIVIVGQRHTFPTRARRTSHVRP
jgi:hypothetical protein